jgi:hypothetical protein
MTTDTSERGLVPLICAALTDEPDPIDEAADQSDADEAASDDLDVAPEEAEA